MRFYSESFESRRERLRRWHLWFAWYPVRATGENKKIWLERVWRRGELKDVPDFPYWDWEYRAAEDESVSCEES